MRKLLSLSLLLLGCATIPRGSTICVGDDIGSASIDPVADRPVSTCNDLIQAMALAKKIQADAGLHWRKPKTIRVRASEAWTTDGQSATAPTCWTVFGYSNCVAGTEDNGAIETGRCLSSLSHEDLHWVETNVFGTVPADELLNAHGEWTGNGYWGVESFFEYVWASTRPTPFSCQIFRLDHMTLPARVEGALRGHGWGPKIDEWRTLAATSSAHPEQRIGQGISPQPKEVGP